MSESTFRAAVVTTPTGPASVEFVDSPLRRLRAGEVRVAVAAAAINPVDIGVVTGWFHAMGLISQPRYTGLGWDFSGTVTEVGPDGGIAVGDRVAGVVVGFDRDYGTFAEQLVVPASSLAVVPDGVGLVEASTVPLNGLAAVQVLGLLGDPSPDRDRLLVTGAAGAVGGHLLPLARDRGWKVTGLARAHDHEFVRQAGAELATEPTAGWDAVADAAALQERALRLVRDGGRFVGVQPARVLAPERDITVDVVVTQPDSRQLQHLFARVAGGSLPVRVHRALPLEEIHDALELVAKGGIRGRVVLLP